MKYFETDYIDFLRSLSANNNRDWFQENKKHFKAQVETPFHAFVDDLIKRMRRHLGGLEDIEAKQCVFRIYRDVRFGKDKTPYKNHMSALISASGRKGMDLPGIYIQSSGEDLRLYTGAHHVEKDALHRLRTAIMKDPKGFRKVITGKKFVDVFGAVLGEKNKRLPKEFQEAALEEPLLFNKSFYYFKKWEAEAILEPGIAGELIKSYQAANSVNEFLYKAILVGDE